MIRRGLLRLLRLLDLPVLPAIAAVSLVCTGCRNDPAAQSIIDSLGPEKGAPGPEHRPGQPCLACHGSYGPASQQFAVAGTVFSLDATMKAIVPAKNVRVTIVDSNKSNSRKACTNAAGNFFILADSWTDITYPLSPTAGGLAMQSLVGRDGSCASCHRLPDTVPDRGANSLNPVTGADHDSAGVILATQVDPTCGGSQ